jgi:hypothetical protein
VGRAERVGRVERVGRAERGDLQRSARAVLKLFLFGVIEFRKEKRV